MIDLKDLRQNPDKYRKGAEDKGMQARLVDTLLDHDARLRELMAEREALAAEKNQIGREIGQVAAQLKKAEGDAKNQLQQKMKALQQRPNEIKLREQELDDLMREIEPMRDQVWLHLPQPADADVPVGKSSADNIEIRQWHPEGFNPQTPFIENRGFHPRTHVELMENLGMVDFKRGVKMAGSRSYVLTGRGMQLHNAVLRYAFDYMTNENGFTPMSVPVIVRGECMVGTGFFPHGKEQAYQIANPTSAVATGTDSDDLTSIKQDNELYLTGTGEVGLMGLHQNEILDYEQLPLCYTTVSTCFRREAGAAGKDTRGLYRIHQFDKVEQVVICKADVEESRRWHKKMIGFVEAMLQRLRLPYRLLQCCTGDLGPKNVDMIDIESWMPGRGEIQEIDGREVTCGDWGETHSASRLYDYQARRLNMRYRDPQSKKNITCHSLNNTVAASPRILIPIVEMYQNEDGSITVPEVLRPYMAGLDRID